VGGGGRLEELVERFGLKGWEMHMAFQMLERGHTVYQWHRRNMDNHQKRLCYRHRNSVWISSPISSTMSI
jgi:hypothetical protein